MRKFPDRWLRLLFSLLLAAFLCVPAASPLRAAGPGVKRPDVLIDSVLAAYGGTAALAKVAGYRMEGTVASRMSGSGAMVRSFARPDRLKITLDYPGRREVRILDGGKLQGLEIPVGDGLTLTAYVETATGRIVRSSGVLEAPGMKTNFATDYSDFRMVGGILFPFREGNFASDQPTGETVITRIVVNPPLKDTDFRP